MAVEESQVLWPYINQNYKDSSKTESTIEKMLIEKVPKINYLLSLKCFNQINANAIFSSY